MSPRDSDPARAEGQLRPASAVDTAPHQVPASLRSEPRPRRGLRGSASASASASQSDGSLGAGRYPLVDAYVAHFFPPRAKDWPIEDRQRVRLLLLLAPPYTLALLASALYQWGLGFHLGAAIFGGLVLTTSVGLFIFRRTAALRWAANSTVLLGLIGLVSVVWLNGGMGVPAIFGLSLAPMMVLLISSRRWALFWALVCTGLLVGFYALDRAGHSPEVRFGGQLNQARLVVALVITWLGFSVAGIFDRFKVDALVRLEEERDRARSANQAKTAFLANMSHELRTPMNGVIGMLDVVLDGELPGAAREQLVVARRAANSFTGLLDAILDLSRLEEGGLQLQPRAFDLRTLFEELEVLFGPSARAKGLSLHFDASEVEFDEVFADPLRVRQVAMNLIANAIKFTDRGEVRVTLGSSASGRRILVQLVVEDTGVGIAAEDLERIFERFEQADASARRRLGGAGLGLAITRQLVALMGGEVVAAHRTGGGARFQVEFLVDARPELGRLDPQVGRVPTWMGELSTRGPKRVLVVDDDPVNREVAVAALRVMGCRAESVDDGQRAIERAHLGELDLVLMDCHMPGMDGFEATRRLMDIEAIGSRVPIVALTASVTQEDRRRCYAAGMREVLAKPLRRSELASLLERVDRGEVGAHTLHPKA